MHMHGKQLQGESKRRTMVGKVGFAAGLVAGDGTPTEQ